MIAALLLALTPQGVAWTDARELRVEGQGWTETAAPWGRLPARAEEQVRPQVWNLSRQSSGIAIRFVSAAPAIHARWTLTQERLAMTHMPATGVSGVDLYARDADGTWRWIAVGQPHGLENEARLVHGLPVVEREYLLYLPLYNGTASLAIGVPDGHSVQPGPLRPEGRRAPVVFYGTSITHGASASRPGATHAARLGRWLDRPIVNLGFSGNGRLEPEVGAFVAELDAAAFVLDCLPNLNAKQVAERAAPLVRQLRAVHPDTPILLVEDRTFADAWIRPGRTSAHEQRRAALRGAYEELLTEGAGGLWYLEGDRLLGRDGEDTVDASHPNDLGFERQARAFLPVLLEMLDARGAEAPRASEERDENG